MARVDYPGLIPPDVPSRKASVTAEWLRTIKQALHDAQYAVFVQYGQRNGVLGCGDTLSDSMKVRETAPASMQVDVNIGLVCAFETVVRKRLLTRTAAMVAPTANPVIYLVQYNVSTQAVTLKAGVEAAEPVAPITDNDCIPLATVYLRVGATSVKETDDSTNGYITDARVFLNL